MHRTTVAYHTYTLCTYGCSHIVLKKNLEETHALIKGSGLDGILYVKARCPFELRYQYDDIILFGLVHYV